MLSDLPAIVSEMTNFRNARCWLVAKNSGWSKIRWSCCWTFSISGIETGDTILEQWYYEGDLYSETYHTINRSGFNCMWDPLILRDSDAAYLTGNWSVDFYYNDEKTFTETFFISGISKPFAVVNHVMTNTTDNCTCGEGMPPEITVMNASSRFSIPTRCTARSAHVSPTSAV